MQKTKVNIYLIIIMAQFKQQYHLVMIQLHRLHRLLHHHRYHHLVNLNLQCLTYFSDIIHIDADEFYGDPSDELSPNNHLSSDEKISNDNIQINTYVPTHIFPWKKIVRLSIFNRLLLQIDILRKIIIDSNNS